MKLGFRAVEVERSAAFKSSQFGIGDTRVIMEILRGKMYSNPVQTICQEIMCNARDAHREVGKGDVPIEVKLPTKLDPSFWIRDFGPSVTPDRMANVFILYGNSTKRGNNVETGGFGLGAKCPFSYTDTFTVISTTQEGKKRIRRQYLAHIDESGKGEMTLVQEQETEEPQGTCIVITPKTQDIPQFKKFVKQTAAHWDVQPVIHGDPDWEWPTFEVPYRGKNWAVHHHKATRGANRYYPRNTDWVYAGAPIALIDGIPYRLTLSHIFPKGIPREISRIGSIPFRLYFDVGEVAVTANREDLDYQPRIIEHLQKRLRDAVSELQKCLTNKMKDIDNLFDAVLNWQELRRQSYGYLLDATQWKGHVLQQHERFVIDRKKDIFVSIYSRDNQSRTGCRKQPHRAYLGRGNPNLHIRKNSIFVLDDTGKKVVARARLATLLDKHPDVGYIYLVNLAKKETTVKNDKGIDTMVVVPATDKEIGVKKAYLEKTHKWSLLKPVNLSSYEKKELAPAEKRDKARKPAIRIRKFTGRGWIPSEAKDISDTLNYYIEVSGNSNYFNKSKGQTIKPRELQGLYTLMVSRDKKFKLFGVIPSHVQRLDDTWKPLRPILEKTYDEYRGKMPKSLKIGASAHSVLNSQWFSALKKASSEFDKDSPLKKWLEQSSEVAKKFEYLNFVNQLGRYIRKHRLNIDRRSIDHKTEIGKLYKESKDRYPLLWTVCKSYSYTKLVLDDLIKYVNMKDIEVDNA